MEAITLVLFLQQALGWLSWGQLLVIDHMGDMGTATVTDNKAIYFIFSSLFEHNLTFLNNKIGYYYPSYYQNYYRSADGALDFGIQSNGQVCKIAK